VIAFTYRGTLGAAELGRALDALLPGDVAVRNLRRVPAGFHPRHAARYREYRYTVWNGPRSPLRERQALGVRIPLDTAAMARAGRPSRAGTTSPPSGRRTGSRSGPFTGSGSGGTARS
jgi:tRNA pseudouridine38-40 synthase